MSNVRIQTGGLRKVEVPAAKLWGAAQTQRSLEHYCKKITEYVYRSPFMLSLGDPRSRNKSISTGIACANVTAARHAKQYRGNSSNLDDLSARNWIAEQPNGVL